MNFYYAMVGLYNIENKCYIYNVTVSHRWISEESDNVMYNLELTSIFDIHYYLSYLKVYLTIVFEEIKWKTK